MDEIDLAALIERDIAAVESMKQFQPIDSGAFNVVETTITQSHTLPAFWNGYISLYFTADTQVNPFAELSHSYQDIEIQTRVSPVDSKMVHFRWRWTNGTSTSQTIVVKWSVLSNDTGVITF